MRAHSRIAVVSGRSLGTTTRRRTVVPNFAVDGCHIHLGPTNSYLVPSTNDGRMAFVRTKTIKGHDYEYLVETYREGDKVKQRVIKYLGRKKGA